MSTYCLKSTLRRGTGFFILLLVVGLLIAQQLVTLRVTFASAAKSGYQFGKSAALDKASVSVVRLVVGYASTPAITGCTTAMTGLGVLVGSWATNAGSKDFTNWVLTDGLLLNPDPLGISCRLGNLPEQLNSIQIYLNNAYTSSASALVLKSLQCRAGGCTDQPTAEKISCQNTSMCDQGAVLLPFHTGVPQPFIDMSPTNQTTPAPFGIELTGPVFPPVSAEQAVQALEPVQVVTSDPKNELGMPIVSSNGQLLDMKTKGSGIGAIRTFVKALISPAPAQSQHTNTLHDSWNQGILDFYASHFVLARSGFLKASTANSQFRAPAAF
ncbi:MAG TPA: hypothetical protein VIY29_27760, partial [Ktedonobacteraceae bacterium]